MDEITGPQLAILAGISPQKARAALALGASGKLWRGVVLETRFIHGRGGAGGKARTATVRSLPPDLKVRWTELRTPVQLALKLDGDSVADRDWWTAVLAPASCHPARSKERTAAVRTILWDWD